MLSTLLLNIVFSKSAKYALKAVLFLAVHSDEDHKVMVKDIAKPINVPQAYIAKLLQELSKQNIISSTRGVNGGFYLSELNNEQTLISILNAIDGKNKMNSCLLSLDNCNDKAPCPMHNIFNPTRNKFIECLKTKSVKELALDIKSGISVLPL